MTGLELLVGADAFWRRAAADCAGAERRLLVQAMTFEGDEAGKAVAAAIAASPAADRRVLVDAYSRVVISDRWAALPPAFLPPGLRREKAATRAMFADLLAGGVPVRVTNPFTPLMTNYPARNHKKLVVADDVAYLGGINFSDHNFAWRDFMLRIEGADAAGFLAGDFEATWAGTPSAASRDLDGIRVLSLDGRTNDGFFAEFRALLASARREIVVLSAYLTFPFTGPLADAARRGVPVTLVTPWANNKPIVRDHLLSFARRHSFDVRVLPKMSHLKGLLVDDETLIVGSCNFDFVGHAAEEELIAVVRAPALIEDFRTRIIEPALAEASEPRQIAPLAGALAHAALKAAELGTKLVRGGRRTSADWT
ncbi:MAG: phospholipase D-like domain-containing protein [Caulobacteraceae bacterium]